MLVCQRLFSSVFVLLLRDVIGLYVGIMIRDFTLD